MKRLEILPSYHYLSHLNVVNHTFFPQSSQGPSVLHDTLTSDNSIVLRIKLIGEKMYTVQRDEETCRFKELL